MTKNLSALFPAINDEVAEAFAGAFSPYGAAIGYSQSVEYIPVTDGASLLRVCSARPPILLQTGRPCRRWM
jgi:hypothetical protein